MRLMIRNIINYYCMNIIPIYKPYLVKYKKCAIDAINSEWISNHGKYVELATQKFQDIIGIKYCILMANGTAATHCLFLSLKFIHPEVKVIYIPNNVYVAVYNCALMEYDESQIKIMKINKDTLNLDYSDEYLCSLNKDSAIVVVHNVGNIIDVNKIKKLRPDIIIVEDNCEGLFGKYGNNYSGTLGLCSSVSFYGNKTITTGEGGAFLTNNTELFNYISSAYSQGMSHIKYIHDVHAYNYRMTNIAASILYEQLCDLDHILALKSNIFINYKTLLNDLLDDKQISLPMVDKNCESACWMFIIKFNNSTMNLDELSNYFKNYNIDTRPFFYSYHKHKHLINLVCDEDVNELNNNIIMIPSYPELTFENQKYICSIISKLCSEF